MPEPAELPEFLVFAKDRFTGKPLPSFIVPATDAIAARRMSENDRLEIDAVEVYAEQKGMEKPKVCPLGPLDKLEQAEYTEYLVFAEENDTGKPYPLFLVPAPDKWTAQRLCQRRYLKINSIERYHDDDPEGEKPRVYPWGPPVSDRKFERTYHHRTPENEVPAAHKVTSQMQVLVFGLALLAVSLLLIVWRALATLTWK